MLKCVLSKKALANFTLQVLDFHVGVAGFEPATSCSQSRRADRATLHPEFLPDRFENIKSTCDMMLPTFLLARKVAERGGFEPPVPLFGYGSLANCWFQPLTHLSGKAAQKYKKQSTCQNNISKNRPG